MFVGANVHETRKGNIKYSQHAEMSALRKYIKYQYGKDTHLGSCPKLQTRKLPELYVVRLTGSAYAHSKTQCESIGSDGECLFNNSLPCKDCQKNLIKFGINTIKYTNIIDEQSVLCELKLKNINSNTESTKKKINK